MNSFFVFSRCSGGSTNNGVGEAASSSSFDKSSLPSWKRRPGGRKENFGKKLFSSCRRRVWLLLLSGLNPQALIKGMDGDAPEILYGADGMVEVGLGGSCNTHCNIPLSHSRAI